MAEAACDGSCSPIGQEVSSSQKGGDQKMNFGMHWRPKSAHGVPLTDFDLAKVGLLSQLYVQCVFHVALALKGAEQLDFNQWKQAQDQAFDPLAKRLVEAARKVGDTKLIATADVIAEEHPEVFKHRHQSMHSLYSVNDTSNLAHAYDVRRNEWLSNADFDAALDRVAAFSQKTCYAGNRVAELIIEGKLPGRKAKKGPSIMIHNQLVHI